jgi:predicted nuclease of predicted toxin-antitoxin system
MPYRLLLDENVEHEVGHRLENYGHDVVHVDFEPELGKWATEDTLAAYSIAEDRVLVTDDDDFVLTLSENAFNAVLYLSDASLPVDHVADIVHEVTRQYPQVELDGVVYIGPEWL